MIVWCGKTRVTGKRRGGEESGAGEAEIPHEDWFSRTCTCTRLILELSVVDVG